MRLKFVRCRSRPLIMLAPIQKFEIVFGDAKIFPVPPLLRRHPFSHQGGPPVLRGLLRRFPFQSEMDRRPQAASQIVSGRTGLLYVPHLLCHRRPSIATVTLAFPSISLAQSLAQLCCPVLTRFARGQSSARSALVVVQLRRLKLQMATLVPVNARIIIYVFWTVALPLAGLAHAPSIMHSRMEENVLVEFCCRPIVHTTMVLMRSVSRGPRTSQRKWGSLNKGPLLMQPFSRNSS